MIEGVKTVKYKQYGICPQCKAELTELRAESDCSYIQSFDLKEGFWSGEYSELSDDAKFFCPECFEEIAETEEQAKDFLEGLRMCVTCGTVLNDMEETDCDQCGRCR